MTRDLTPSPSSRWSLRREIARHGSVLEPGALAYMHVRARESKGLAARVAAAVSFHLLKRLHHTEINGKIGEGVRFVHGTNVLIHPRATIGARVTLMHDVVVGTALGAEDAPVIEDDVQIGAGAKVLGRVVVGRGAKIAANALVLSDVPPGATALGNPARIIRSSSPRSPAER